MSKILQLGKIKKKFSSHFFPLLSFFKDYHPTLCKEKTFFYSNFLSCFPQAIMYVKSAMLISSSDEDELYETC